MKFSNRPLAITDVETTGLDANIHEIVELGLLVVEQKTLKTLDHYEVKIRPVNMKNAARQALVVCGYNEREWRKAVDLETAMHIYSEKTKDAIFVAHNVYFDWSFITRAFQKTGIEDYMDYHRIDLFTSAWAKAQLGLLPKLSRFNLSDICKYFDIKPEPHPHRAINGARSAHAVLKKLLKLPQK